MALLGGSQVLQIRTLYHTSHNVAAEGLSRKRMQTMMSLGNREVGISLSSR